MLETVTSKFKASKVSHESVNSKNAVTQNLKSNEKRLRSLSVHCSHNVMGKNKYRAVRKSNRNV